MTELSQKKCVPCTGAVPPLAEAEREALLAQVDEGWAVIDGHHLEREYRFDNFRQALDFTREVGEVAEEQGHHPDLLLSWGRVRVTIWTHQIDGLTESDFILAAKIDHVLSLLQAG